MADIGQTFNFGIIQPLKSLWDGLLNTIPGVVGALIVIIVGYLVSLLVAWIVERVLVGIKFDKYCIEKTNLTKVLGAFRMSHFLALLSRWLTFILFLSPAATIVKLKAVSGFLDAVASWIPNVFAAVLIGIFGLMAADYIAMKIEDLKAKASGFIASTAKVVIVIVTILMALRQVGIKISLAENSFLIILAGIMLAIALMIGIGFGMALKEDARRCIGMIKKRL